MLVGKVGESIDGLMVMIQVMVSVIQRGMRLSREIVIGIGFVVGMVRMVGMGEITCGEA